jgi:uncharacterized membrane protein YebE (DUF533 family)
VADADAPPLDLRSPGWLHQLLTAYLETYPAEQAARAVASAQSAWPDDPPDVRTQRLALARLEGVGLRPSRLAIRPDLAERIGADGLARDDLEAVGLLVTRWDIVQDIARLHRGTAGVESPLELLTILALGLQDYPLARRLEEAHEDEVDGVAVDHAPLAELVAERMTRRAASSQTRASLSIGVGLAFIEARVLGRIAALYYERASIEEEGIRQLHELSASEKTDLLEVLVYVAWADGVIAPEERTLIERQIELAELEKGTSKHLRRLLGKRPAGRPDVRPMADPETRRFVLEQAILLSLVDDDQAEAELVMLEDVARQLGASPGELEAIMVEVSAWYERNRELIRDLGPVGGSLGRLRQLVIGRAQDAVRSNMRKIVQEIKETGELAKLLGAASVRQLTPEESAKVRSQLLDVCKTVPALAIFLLPGGGLLLPVLIKLLPFNILPTAFEDGVVATGEPSPGLTSPDPPQGDA